MFQERFYSLDIFILSLKFGHLNLKGLHFEVISILWPKSTMVDESCTVFKNSLPPLFFSDGADLVL